jgi:hypothetical protein
MPIGIGIPNKNVNFVNRQFLGEKWQKTLKWNGSRFSY